MRNFLLIILVITNGVIAFAQIPNYVPLNGLVGYWPFNNNANDQSFNANNGSVFGANLTTDRFNNLNSAYSFNGTSNYITIPNNTSLSGFNNITISSWVNTSQFTGIQGIVTKWFFTLNCGNNTDNYNASFANNKIVFATNNNNFTGYTSPYNFGSNELNTWIHLVFVSSATQGISIYINGVLSGTNSVTGSICSSTNPLYFGAVNPNTRFFKGKLDDIGIWNRALSKCEIMELYTASSLNLTTTSTSTLLCVGNTSTISVTGANNYVWDNNVTDSMIVVSPTITTTYSVVGTNTYTGCSKTVSITQNVSLCTGLNDFNNNEDFLISIFPNPTFDIVNIESTEKINTITVSDATGKILLIEKNKNNFSLASLPNGLYFINVVTNNGTLNKKIMKQ